MRKIIALAFLTIDGVMQAPGGPEEDPSGGFAYGGWTAPFDDGTSGEIMEKLMKPADLLLGRQTYEIFASYWPQHAEHWPGINEVTKYVLSTTLDTSEWENTVFLKELSEIEKLKNTQGADIKIWGSSKLVQSLLQHDLVDEFWLMIHPVILGKGKKLFGNDSVPTAYEVVETFITASGVIMVNYRRNGDVGTGTAGETQ